MGRFPQRQRVAAYAVILRDDQILLCRLAPRIAGGELWTLPGGGLDHGEDPGRRGGARDPRGDRPGRRGVPTSRAGLLLHTQRPARRRRGGRPRAADRLRRLGAGRLARARGSSRSTARRSRRPGSRWPTCRSRQGAGHRPGAPRRSPTTGPSRCSGWRRTPWSAATDSVLLTRISGRGHHPGRGRCPAAASTTARSRRGAGARGPRGVRPRLRGRRSCSTSTTHFAGTAPSRSARGLPRRAPGLRRHGAGRRRAARRRRSAAPPTPWRGCRWRTSSRRDRRPRRGPHALTL